jgi:hypothetical protein
MRSILKRWYFWVTLLVFLPLLFVSIGLIYSSQGPINQANFDRVQEGMTEEQVVAILGEPTFKEGFVFADTLMWLSGPDVITVTLDREGKVFAKGYNPPTVWRRLRWHADEFLSKVGLGRG